MEIVFTVVLLLLIIGGIGFLYFGKDPFLKRDLRFYKNKPISEFQTGEIGKVVGRLQVHQKTLRAPLSGRKCVYYQVLVEREESEDIGSNWYTMIEDEKAVDFVLAQGKDKVLVVANDYKGTLVKDQEYTSGFLNDATKDLEDYLQKFGKKSEGFLGFNKTLRYREGILEAGEMVAVKGVASWETEDKKLSRTKSGKYLVLRGGVEKMLISDDPKMLD